MTPIRAVTFDCWGTLLADHDMSRARERRVEAIADISGLDADRARELLDRAWRTHHDTWVAGQQYGSPGIARFCVDELGLDAASCLEGLCTAFEDAAFAGDVRPLDGAADTLAALRDAGIRTALVCDTGFSPGRVVRRLLAEYALVEHLEFLAFSNEVGVPKPHPKIFEAALGALGAEPGEAVHIGDLRRTDIAGARNIGMRTVRIRAVNDDDADPSLPEADEVVDAYSDLPDVLRRFGAPL